MNHLELLRKLVTRFHLSVPERRELGSPVPRDELVETILAILMGEGFYPPHVRPWKPGTSVYEGTILEMLPGGRCRGHTQCATAYGAIPQGITTAEFDNARVAVVRLIESDFKHGIDGIPIT